MGHYYHLFANGDDAQNFITSEEDFKAAFNRFGICAARYPKVKVLAFSIEESHPHGLLYGEYDDCLAFKCNYESTTYRYIVSSRGDKDGVVFELELSQIDSEEYLLNAAAYVIVQPTKDGKQIMPYDYRWGTGSVYFRPKGHPLLWCFDKKWHLHDPVCFGQLTYRQKSALTHSKFMIPDSWLICQGIILPTNYLALAQYEMIFKSFNRYRTYLSAGRKQIQPVIDSMASARGIRLEDVEARKVAYETSERLFGKKNARWLSPNQRLTLARELRNRFTLSIRQIATLTRLPESEVRKYLK